MTPQPSRPRDEPLAPSPRRLTTSLPRALATLALSALTGACAAAGPPPASAPSPLLNNSLPQFERPAMDGNATGSDQVRGKVVVVKFFAKYCKPCTKTLPAVQALHDEHSAIAFIGVAEDESEEDVQEMIRTYGLTFPVIHDRDNVLAGRFRVTQMPATFVADGQGNVRWVGGEGQTEDDLKRAIHWADSL